MGRPRKIDSEVNELRKHDTMYWTGLVKASSGLTDADIEARLETAGLSKKQIEVMYSGKNYNPPTGRSFNRWRTGQRAMDHDAIQRFVQRARLVGLLERKKNFGSHKQAAVEARTRAHSNGEESANDELLAKLKILRELHEARRELDAAAQKFQTCAVAADRCGIDVFDTPREQPTHRPDDDMLEPCQVDSIANQISDIASWYFLDGLPHGLAS